MKRNDVVLFYGRTKPDPKYWAFSNFYPARMKVGDYWYATNEHFYQASKAMNDEDHHRIRLLPTPREAMLAGRSEHLVIRSDWEDFKLDVMYAGLCMKFIQHADLADLLVSTGDAEIIEYSPVDYFWGCGANNTGRNELGKMLMRVRSLLN